MKIVQRTDQPVSSGIRLVITLFVIIVAVWAHLRAANFYEPSVVVWEHHEIIAGRLAPYYIRVLIPFVIEAIAGAHAPAARTWLLYVLADTVLIAADFILLDQFLRRLTGPNRSLIALVLCGLVFVTMISYEGAIFTWSWAEMALFLGGLIVCTDIFNSD